MSIISEALKKAQYKKEDAKTPAAKIAPVKNEPKPLAAGKPAGPERRSRPSFTILLGIFIIMILAVVFFMLRERPEPVKFASYKELRNISGGESVTAAGKETTEAGPAENAPAAVAVQKTENFTPANQAAPARIPEINLSGIMYSAKKPLAVINDRIMTEGDEFGNVKVVQILPGSVMVSINGGEAVEVRLSR